MQHPKDIGFIFSLPPVAPESGLNGEFLSVLQLRKAAFFGTTLSRQRRVGAVVAKRQSQQQVARAGGKQISVDIEKPVGLGFKESRAAGGGLVVTVRAVYMNTDICHSIVAMQRLLDACVVLAVAAAQVSM